jgi:cobalt/nickel transport protein
VRRVSTRVIVAAGLLVALLLAGVVSYYASNSPDGLNRVAKDHGFSDTQRQHPSHRSPLAGYGTKGVSSDRLSGGVAGVAGSLVVLVLAGGLALVVRRRGSPDRADTRDALEPEEG